MADRSAAPTRGSAAPRKILVIMLRRIGDVLLTTPAVRALKKLFPGAEIHFLTEPPCDEVLEGLPELARVHRYALGPGESAAGGYWRWLRLVRAERYDWVIDYMGNPRSAILTFASGAPLRAGPAHVWHRWAYNRRLQQSPAPCYAGLEKIRVLRSLGLSPDESDFLPTLSVPPPAREAARRVVAELFADAAADPGRGGPDPGRAGPLIGLVPASRKPTRRWPASSYGELGRRLADATGARFIVFWGPGEEALAEKVTALAGPTARVAPRTPRLGELAALLSCCSLVVTNCNGPKHIAVACGTPTLTIHGSSDPACWNPPHPRHLVARLEDLHCIACRLNDCPYALECMRELSPEGVAFMALELLRETATTSGATK
ncbi:MAG: glycosyltransferase family 9 protein [Elusimicrobia bacterium]|nr:glycosyltransferase family 9 protein [Elusimicrobiota bacterium]